MFNESDASIKIKKLDNVYIDKKGYELAGTMIGCNILTIPEAIAGENAYMAYQHKGIVYTIYEPIKSNTTNYIRYSSNANIFYI